MKRRVGVIWIGVLGALLSGVVWSATGALAQTANSSTSAPASADVWNQPATPVTAAMAQAAPDPWWFHGTVEVGGRFFINNPQDHHQTATGPAVPCFYFSGCNGVAGKSLSSYYEYTDVAPGVFGNFAISTGSKNGLYEIDLGGHNVGYDDESYYFDFSEVGKQYFSFEWDQTPHVYSRNALTPYVVNGNTLTTNSCASGQATAAALAACATPADIGIRRDTASFKYRWTPNDAWDFHADYSHMDRYGTQPGAVYGNHINVGVQTFGGTMLPKPVDDTTQNYAVNGEYVGTSPWGQRIVFKAGYLGSTYTDNFDAYTISGTSSPAVTPNGAQISTWPSNQANGFDATLAADLTTKSRYTGILNYTVMTQNDGFIPASFINPALFTPSISSLNGEVDTLMSYNQLTTKLTPELTSKLTYRYYDFDNKTPELNFTDVPVYDRTTSTVTTNSISMGYTKQNAAEELNWRPSRKWNLGGILGFERYDWTRADVNVTNEFNGKLYATWKPNSWFGLRSSVFYGNRRYDNYDYLSYVGGFQWPSVADGCGPTPTSCDTQYMSSYRQLMIDNRQVWKANVSSNIVVVDGLTLSPTFKYEDDNYGVDPTTQQGLQDNNTWSAGIDATYLINPTTSFTIGYMYSRGEATLYGNDCGGGNPCTGSQMVTNDTTTVHSITALFRYAVVPGKLDTSLRYVASYGIDNMKVYPASSIGGDQFPNNKNWYQRLDATATYTFDKDELRRLGWKGTVKAKLHYTWERNSETNWANDPLSPYTTVASGLYLAWYNPNYNVQMITASLAFGW